MKKCASNILGDDLDLLSVCYNAIFQLQALFAPCHGWLADRALRESFSYMDAGMAVTHALV
jgi:hypothetical protein